MKARVRFFARLAEVAGTRETEVELGEGLSVGDAFRLLCQRFPKLADHADSLAALDEVEDEWDKRVKMFGEFETAESILRSPVRHLKEHEADALKVLGRG